MKKGILISLALVVLIGCTSSHVNYIRDNPNRLKPGLLARAFEEAWGKPDFIFSFKDYQQTEYNWYYQGGSYYSPGFGYGSTYTPMVVVWIYKKQNKILFFQQCTLLNEQRNPLSTMVWKLVGWLPITNPNQ